MLIRGTWHRGGGLVVTDEAVVVEHLEWLVGPLRGVDRLLGTSVSSRARLRRMASDYVLVVVSSDGDPGGGP